MTGGAFEYGGSELELFAHAHGWKRYLRTQLGPYLHGDVLEVGSGIGSTTRALHHSDVRSWTALEPDEALSRRGREALSSPPATAGVVHEVGVLGDLDPTRRFDTILYVDVLEHIDDDRAEVALAAQFLRPSGRLVVLGPAHQWLFTPFDEAVGHHRRYGTASLRSLTPATLVLERISFLDSAGLLASCGNRLLLRSAHPSPGQLDFWDRRLVPISRRLDPVLGRRVGKSVVGVWSRQRPGG